MASLTQPANDKLKILEEFGVTRKDVEIAIREPDIILSDTETGNLIAIRYATKIAVAYSTRAGRRTVTTIIYSTELEDLTGKRRRSGRWNQF